MGYEELVFTVENGNLAVITLNRPDAMNALTMNTYDELAKAIDEATADKS